MSIKDLIELERLLKLFREDAVDREEFDKRESLRFDVGFEIGKITEVRDE